MQCVQHLVHHHHYHRKKNHAQSINLGPNVTEDFSNNNQKSTLERALLQ